MDIRACPEKNCDLVFAENEFGMKAHVSPNILAQDEVRFYCVFCTTLQNFESESILNKHIVDAHFYAKFEKGLKKKPPFNCPFSFCRFNGRTAQDLVYHYAGPEHHVFQKILTKAKYDLILKANNIDDSGRAVTCHLANNNITIPFEQCGTTYYSELPSYKMNGSSNAPSKEIEAKAFSQMYSDEKARADQLELEVGRLNKEVEGLKKDWQDARAAKRSRETEAKELKLKYDVLKGKYENEVYGGRKTPKKMKDEKESMKEELSKMNKKIEKLNQENLKLEEQIQSGGVEASQNIENVEKRSKSRLVKLRRQKKIIVQHEQKIQELQSLLDFTERQFTALEKKKSELENLNSAVELEFKSESDLLNAKMGKFEAEKSELESRIRDADERKLELEQKVKDLEKEKDEMAQRLSQAEESLKISGDRIEKLKEKIVCGGKMAQLNAQLKKENQILEKRLTTETLSDGTLQTENLSLRRQLEKYKASLNLRDQEIALLRQFDEEERFHSGSFNSDNFIKSEAFK